MYLTISLCFYGRKIAMAPDRTEPVKAGAAGPPAERAVTRSRWSESLVMMRKTKEEGRGWSLWRAGSSRDP